MVEKLDKFTKKCYTTRNRDNYLRRSGVKRFRMGDWYEGFKKFKDSEKIIPKFWNDGRYVFVDSGTFYSRTVFYGKPF